MSIDEQSVIVAKDSRSKRTSWLALALASAAAIALVAVLLLRPSSISADSAMTEHLFKGGQLQWHIEDYPATVLEENSFRLTLTDASGEPLSGAELAIKLEMIDMVCGDYDFTLTETAPGVYIGEGVPLMAGLWKASLTINGDQNGVISRTLKAVY